MPVDNLLLLLCIASFLLITLQRQFMYILAPAQITELPTLPIHTILQKIHKKVKIQIT